MVFHSCLGNGEHISINFKSDKIITFKGFDATYQVVRGNLLFVHDILQDKWEETLTQNGRSEING